MKIRLGEPQFVSIQGEGLRSGTLSVWSRFFGCSLRCPGFFQNDPTDKSTYVDPLDGVEPSRYISVFQLPVVTVGCDSIYSIDPRFKHCATDYPSEVEVIRELYSLLPGGKFKHSITNQTYDWCITGGEPLMNQKAIISLYEMMYDDDNFPYDIQIETNCTRVLTNDMINLIRGTTLGRLCGSTKWWFSMSPKLFHVSGEESKDAWHPEIIKQYWDINPNGWLKFVINDDYRAWIELSEKVAELKLLGVGYPIMIMPVGATYEQQTDTTTLSRIANRAIKEGYHVSGRLHAVLFGNGIGT